MRTIAPDKPGDAMTDGIPRAISADAQPANADASTCFQAKS
jgi:hypothetical protein